MLTSLSWKNSASPPAPNSYFKKNFAIFLPLCYSFILASLLKSQQIL